MSHSTEVEIEIGLDKLSLHGGSRLPATAFEIEANEEKSYTDDAALRILGALPNVGMGNHALYGVLFSMAVDNKETYGGHEGWLKVTIAHKD